MDENWPNSYELIGKYTPVADANTLPYAPLSDEIASTFRSGTYYMLVTKEPITLYRVYGKPDNYSGNDYAKKEGRFWMPEHPGKLGPSNTATLMDYAILDAFKNSRTELATMNVPAGTVVYGYYAAPQNSEINREQELRRLQEKGEQRRLAEQNGSRQLQDNEYLGRRQNLMGGGPQIFIPGEVVKELVKYQETGNSRPVFEAQKNQLKDFEQLNKVSLVNKSGMPNISVFNASIQAQSVGSLPLPKEARVSSFTPRSSCNPGTSRSSNNGSPSANVQASYTTSTPSDRSQRVSSQQAALANFCSSTGLTSSMCRMSAPWPGGVELTQPIRVYRPYTKNYLSVGDIYVYRGELYTRIAYGLKSHKLQLPALVTEEELNCLRHASLKTAKNGLSLSLRLFADKINITTEGIDDLPGWEAVYDTLFQADILLCDLIFGRDQMNSEKTKSNVKSYENPYDVEHRLLHTYKAIKGGEAWQAQNDMQKFTLISPYPKFTMQEKVELKAENGVIQCQEKIIKIGLRGIYEDYYGNLYFDDNGQRCHSHKPFLFDFEKNYFSYLKEYEVLRKLHSYMVIVGIFLGMTGANNKQTRDTTKHFVYNRVLPPTPEDLRKLEEECCQLQEVIIERNTNAQEKLMLYPTIALKYAEFDIGHARDLVKSVLVSIASGGKNIDSTKEKLLLDALNLFHYTTQRIDNSVELMDNREKELFLKLFDVEQIEETQRCSLKNALSIRVVEISLAVALKSERWADASKSVEMLFTVVLDMLMSHLKQIPNEEKSSDKENEVVTDTKDETENQETTAPILDEIKELDAAKIFKDLFNKTTSLNPTFSLAKEMNGLAAKMAAKDAIDWLCACKETEATNEALDCYSLLHRIWNDYRLKGYMQIDCAKTCRVAAILGSVLASLNLHVIGIYKKKNQDNSNEKTLQHVYQGLTSAMWAFSFAFRVICRCDEDELTEWIKLELVIIKTLSNLILFARSTWQRIKIDLECKKLMEQLQNLIKMKRESTRDDIYKAELEKVLDIVYELKKTNEEFVCPDQGISALTSLVTAFAYRQQWKTSLCLTWERIAFIEKQKCGKQEMKVLEMFEKVLKKI